MDTIAGLIDRMVTAELDIQTMADHLLNQFPGGEVPSRPALQVAHNPVTEAEDFHADVQRAAAFCNIHNHSFTCHKGRQGKEACRLGRPAPAAERTNVVQLLTFRDPITNAVGYTVSNEFTPRSLDSLPGRNFKQLPVATRDTNLIYWSVQRRDHDGDYLEKVFAVRLYW